MDKLKLTQDRLVGEGKLLPPEDGDAVLLMPAEGGGIQIPELIHPPARYLSFYLEAKEEHSMNFMLRVYVAGEPVFDVTFGILPGTRTPVTIDTGWMDGHILFPEGNTGELKVVCHGRRVDAEEIERIVLETAPCFHAVTLKISEMEFTEEYPVFEPLPEDKKVDLLGQNKKKSWPSKVEGVEALRTLLLRQEAEYSPEYPYPDWSKYGGWTKKRLGGATGFFTKYKQDGRWYLADPEGYAFFSTGPDCVSVFADCRVGGVEKWLDWLPEEDDAEYREMFAQPGRWSGEMRRENPAMFSYTRANLYRAFGKDWYARWQKMMVGQLRHIGMNTLGNWSDSHLFGTTQIPYVTSLPHFPDTAQKIFRDFPDVLSEEYAQDARRCAKALEAKRDDPWMVGYFLRNEPNWAFVDHLVLADEVFYNPARTVTKEMLIGWLQERYQTVENLNQAYGTDFDSFACLLLQQKSLSGRSEAAAADMKEFSRKLLRAYVEIPSRACREADPNHMILGMRYAWISDPDLVSGWENFDVFSINCYAVDPEANIQNIVDLGVDLPVMIGEFHFGALDAGPSATGLEGVATQKDRGLAYRYYCERAAAHPNGVGCHYFQCYDQFVLGRFDGENYNIGLFDICSQPYPEMAKEIRTCGRTIYEVKAGLRKPTEEKAASIPMIAY